jgi:hypothetical protein
MYSLLRDGLSRRTALLQIPGLAITIVIAETFYKFHSFTLEFVVALATWTVVDLALTLVARGLESVLGQRGVQSSDRTS